MCIRDFARVYPRPRGEPVCSIVTTRSTSVYPRPRGGASSPTGNRHPCDGLSPPTRGSHCVAFRPVIRQGSIPAHAGEPTLDDALSAMRKVYPRPRGGAMPLRRAAWPDGGLSPPTRGSRLPVYRSGCGGGSIPAHAGSRLHPRGRCASRLACTPNPARGSIPAHAGEPNWSAVIRPRSRVYPRPRGGALCRVVHYIFLCGLSPPTRGSPRRASDRPTRSRSIPAHAGEPFNPPPSQNNAWVYPRPRGGARVPWYTSPVTEGLSPPTRGSHGGFAHADSRLGSIPAHAGEPQAAPGGVRPLGPDRAERSETRVSGRFPAGSILAKRVFAAPASPQAASSPSCASSMCVAKISG